MKIRRMVPHSDQREMAVLELLTSMYPAIAAVKSRNPELADVLNRVSGKVHGLLRGYPKLPPESGYPDPVNEEPWGDMIRWNVEGTLRAWLLAGGSDAPIEPLKELVASIEAFFAVQGEYLEQGLDARGLAPYRPEDDGS
jgi:hypothetical protein